MSDDAKPSSGVNSQKALDTDQATPTTKQDKEQQKAVDDLSKVEDNGQQSMAVKIHSPFRDYFDGRAFSLSAENATGPFDILPHHHNFISLLSPCDIVIRTVEKGEQRIRISGGIMHVKTDQIIVFLDV